MSAETGRAKPGIPLMRQAYWDALNAVLDKTGGPVKDNGKSHGQSHMKYTTRVRHFNLYPMMHIGNREIRVALKIEAKNAKTLFQLLLKQKDAVEKDLGYQLEWEASPDHLYSRIVDYNRGVDPTDRQDWPYQHQWFAEHLNNMHRVFVDRVGDLSAELGVKE